MKTPWINAFGMFLSIGLIVMPLSAGAVVQDDAPTIVVGTDGQPEAVDMPTQSDQSDRLESAALPETDMTAATLSFSEDTLSDGSAPVREDPGLSLNSRQDKSTQTDNDIQADGKAPERDDGDKRTSADSTDDSDDLETKVNINTADVDELVESLSGIGPSKAKEIVKYREKQGPFKKIEHLKKVKGIGPATYENIKSQLEL